MKWTKDEFWITTDKAQIDLVYVHAFLRQSYWAKDIPIEVVKKSIEGAFCFAVLHGSRQVGFARVITDEATFAYLADVFIDPEWRGKGLSKWLMEVITSLPALSGLRRFLLVTRDAHDLYRKFGFAPITHTDRFMSIHKPGIYTSQPGQDNS